MPDLTTAVEIAAKVFHETANAYAIAHGAEPLSAWHELHPVYQDRKRYEMFPVIVSLADAGLLKEDQS